MPQLDGFLPTFGDLLQCDFDFNFQGGSGLRAAVAAPVEDAIEKRIAKTEAKAAEDFLEVNAAEEVLGRNPGGCADSARVIGGALFRIG
jgi:hypothetical protein